MKHILIIFSILTLGASMSPAEEPTPATTNPPAATEEGSPILDQVRSVMAMLNDLDQTIADKRALEKLAHDYKLSSFAFKKEKEIIMRWTSKTKGNKPQCFSVKYVGRSLRAKVESIKCS